MASVEPSPSSELPVSVSVSVPSYSRWFSYKKISECESRMLPEFFDGSKNPRLYKYLRNSIVRRYRLNPTNTLSFSDVRKTLVGDVASIRRVFDFLETWGLINYSPPPPPPNPNPPTTTTTLPSSSTTTTTTSPNPPPNSNNNNAKPDDITAPDADSALNKRRTCGGCKSACSIACFSCDKYDLILCARCYVRGNYRIGVSSADFRRIEISEDQKRDWTHKEMLQLLEAVTHYGDDWKKVSQLVSGRTDKECIAQFIKLPFGEEFSGFADLGDPDTKYRPVTDNDRSVDGGGSSSPSKRPRLTPLADASNPIMAQSAFLSALAGDEVAEAAARAAVATLTDVEYGASRTVLRSVPKNPKQQDTSGVTNGNSDLNTLERASLEANSLLEREEMDMEQSISNIVQVQMKEIQEKLVRFEKLDLQMEKEWQQFEQLKNLLFVDQLTLLFNHRSSATDAMCPKDEIARTD